MQSCDDCPGSANCAGLNLQPVLVQVYDLFAAGTTDKFDILFALGDEGEALIERYDNQVSHTCWTKAALLAIVEVVGRIAKDAAGDDVPQKVHDSVSTARDAFERFPWHLDELVEQAPDIYALLQEQCPDPDLCDRISKRAFVKVCKEIAYAR